MLSNYFKTSLRNLTRNKGYTFINIFGLSLGIVCALVIFLIIKFELSFDKYHHDVERIYRVVRIFDYYGKTGHDPGVPYALPAAMRNDFPEIEHVTIVDQNYGASVISIREENGSISKYKESPGVAFVDRDFFRILSYDWILGNPETALDNPNSIVISKSLAEKYFGEENALGKQLTYNNAMQLQVTGVVQDVLQNSDLPLDLLIPFDAETNGDDNWGSVSSAVQCYLQLPDNVLQENIQNRLPAFVKKYFPPEDAGGLTLVLQPLKEMHSDTRFGVLSGRTVSNETLIALGLIGLFLLLTACINFVNLNTALAVKRSKEVGVRKVLGSSIARLFSQFLLETAIITMLAVLLSIALAEIVLGQLQSLLGYQLHLSLTANSSVPVFLAVLFGVVTFAAGFYPAIHLASFQPVAAISNTLTRSYGQGLPLRKGLVVMQFAISQILIISTIVISSQIKYFTSKDMGFNKEAIVEVSLPLPDLTKLRRFKQKLLQHNSIKQVTFSNTGTASTNSWAGDYELTTPEEIKKGNAQIKFVDDSFINTYGIQVIIGEPFLVSDTLKKFLVNETFAKRNGFANNYDTLIGNKIEIWSRKALIAGVVKDFNAGSLHREINELVLVMQNRYWLTGIKINMDDIAGAIAGMESAWDEVFPEFVFDYTFLDETIAKFYEEEQRTANLINIFALIAIFIGCLGLFGLVSYMASQRTKEIGIRKVLGATFSNVITLFSKEFAMLIVIAFLFAGPIAYYFMNAWLTDFAYRVDLALGIFVAALSVSFLISFATVAYKSIRAASANPVESLRYE